uniref:Poly [ADP-ribose] polymerase 8 n=1 Tax=Magallana gigas TaxID=29159 RepID=K1QWH1_MAGGI
MTLRQQRFAEDVNSAIAVCEQYGWPFTELREGSIDRSDSMDTDNSCYEDCPETLDTDEDEEDDDGVDYMDEYDQMREGEEVEINPVLLRDMEKLWGCYGEHVMDYRAFESIEEVDTEIKINLASLLEREIAEAWNLDRLQPLVIRLNLSLSQYLDAPTHDRNIARLMEMGFTADQALSALVLNNGDLLLSVNHLMGGRTTSEGQTTAQASDSSLPPKPSGSEYRRQTSHPSGAKRIKKISRLHSVDPKDIPKDPGIIDLTKDGDDFTLVPTSLWFGKKSKRIPSPNLGFLIQPSVCSRELCVFAFQTLGVMADAAESVATGAEVVDLLIAMTRSACVSPRRDTIFSPYPTVVDPTKSTELALNPKSKDYDKVRKILEIIPPVSQLVQIEPSKIKRQMEEKNVLAYPLLQWYAFNQYRF